MTANQKTRMTVVCMLLKRASIWKQPRYPLVDEWIRKLWYICTMEYYTANKKNTFESVLMRWMKLEPIIQREVNQKEKHQCSILMHIYSCLENPMDRGAWWAGVPGIAQSWTLLKRLSMHTCAGEGNGNPLQCSCMENPRDGGAWWAAVYGVAQRQTWLKRLSSM